MAQIQHFDLGAEGGSPEDLSARGHARGNRLILPPHVSVQISESARKVALRSTAWIDLVDGETLRLIQEELLVHTSLYQGRNLIGLSCRNHQHMLLIRNAVRIVVNDV